MCFNSSLKTYFHNFHLQDGMVYVVGNIDDVVGMAGTRPNVVTIIEKFWNHGNYRMLVSTVDVIFAEIDRHLDEVLFCPRNMKFNISYSIKCTISC